MIDLAKQVLACDFNGAVAQLDAAFSLGLTRFDARAAFRNAQRRREQSRNKSEREALLRQIDALRAEESRLLYNKEQYAPKSEDDPLHPLFLEALQRLETVSLELLLAEAKRNQTEHRERT